jgi:hypothetical protein
VDIEKYYGLQREQITADEQKARKEKYKREIEDAKSAAEEIASINMSWRIKELQASGKMVEALKLQRDEEIKNAQEKGASIFDIQAYYERMIREEQDKTKANAKKNALETIGSWASKIGELGSQFIGIFQSMTENRIASNEKWYESEKAAIEKSTASEKEKKKQLETLDAQYNEKRTALQRDAAKKSKAAAIFEGIIGTASAVIGALGKKPWGLENFVLAAIVGAMGVARTALIAAQPIPFAGGGLVRKKTGGILAQIGEGGEDEIVMPIKTGIQAIVDGIMGKLQSIQVIPQMSVAGAGGGGMLRPITLNIGTFIGDDRGLKELERRLLPIRIAEEQRRGQ